MEGYIFRGQTYVRVCVLFPVPMGIYMTEYHRGGCVWVSDEFIQGVCVHGVHTVFLYKDLYGVW